MVGMNGICVDTYRAWHTYREVIETLEEGNCGENVIDKVCERGIKEGYEIYVAKEGDDAFVSLRYRVSLPVIGFVMKQGISGYTH